MSKEEKANARRATRMIELAGELYRREGNRAQAEGILQAPDMVSVFAAACVMSTVDPVVKTIFCHQFANVRRV